jgi:peptidase M28-like protein/Big-like domain-containing protein/IPT/TIG domain-containing protein/invasin-like protein
MDRFVRRNGALVRARSRMPTSATGSAGRRPPGRLVFALGIALCATLAERADAQGGDPIPAYLGQVSTSTMRAWADTLVGKYGPRRADTRDHFVDGACTWSGQEYPKTTIEMSGDYLRSELEGIGYSVTMEEVPNGSETWGYNVYATKVGSVYPNVFIELGAHYDTQPSTPGGNDNGSGTVSVLELARVLKDYPNRHSMRFGLWVAEEITVPPPGSYHHVQQALARGERIKAGLNIDSTGWADPPVDGHPSYMNEVWYNDAESSRIDDLFQSVALEYGIDIGFRKTPATITSDERAYWLQPVPQTAVTSVGGWSSGVHEGFHGCGDTVDNIDFINVQRAAQQNLAVALKLDAEVIPPVVRLALAPASAPADGSSNVSAVVTVVDPAGAPLRNESVTLQTSGSATVGPVSNNGDGTYTSVITVSRISGDETITATASGASVTAVLHTTPFCPGLCVGDATIDDFGAGAFVGTYGAQTSDGEVMLAPTLGAEFSGSDLPSGLVTTAYPAGGAGTYALGNGQVALDGLILASEASFGPGRSLEFAATFQPANPFQMAGYYRYPNGSGPWAAFDLGYGGVALEATTNPGTGAMMTPTLGNPIAAPHRYRIDWTSSGVAYWVDGVQVASGHPAVASDMPVVFADYTVGGGQKLLLDWFRMSPFSSTGTFTSRVFDAGELVVWRSASWTASTPSGTTITLRARTGNTPQPDASWTSFQPVGNGESLSFGARHLQYEAQLATARSDVSPVLEDVTFAYEATGPPLVLAQSPPHEAVAVPTSSAVTVQFSRAMRAVTFTDGTFRLRAAGASGDVPAVVAVSGSVATLTPTAPLDRATRYRATIAGTVSDANGVALGEDVTWDFTTELDAIVDTVVDDFGAGTVGDGAYLAQTSDGEVILAPALGAEFFGTALPGGWPLTQYYGPGGTAIVGGGRLVLDGAILGSPVQYGPGHVVEFVATYSAGNPYQALGFWNYTGSPWAALDLGASGLALQAGSSAGGTTQVAGSTLGQAHRYRIRWAADQFTYDIDGIQVATTPAITAAMPFMAADYQTGGGAPLALDWVRMSPYAATGVFMSRIFDAGRRVDWRGLSWTATTPADTSIGLQVRVGDTLDADDGTWTAFRTLANGAPVAARTRYLQYQARLATLDPDVTPALESVEVGYTIPVPPPTVTGFSPSSGPATLGATVVIAGSGFQQGATVSFGPATATIETLSSTSITVRVPPGSGEVPVTVANPDGESSTAITPFKWRPPPILQGLSATTGRSSGGTGIAVYGAALLAPVTVTFGGSAAVVTAQPPATVTVLEPAHVAGVVDVTLTNADGQSSTLTGAYRYVDPPTITAVTPGLGPTAGGTLFTVRGTNMASGATVTVGGNEAVDVTVIGGVILTGRTVAHVAGVTDVEVRNPDGQASVLTGAFTFVAPPEQALSVSPASLTFSAGLRDTSEAQHVTVWNAGAAPLALGRIAFGAAGGGAFDATSTCPATLAAGATCTVAVTFTAKAVVTRSTTMAIAVAAPATSRSVSLTGTVIVPTFTVSASSLVFDPQAVRTASPPRAITVTNTSRAPLEIRNVIVSGGSGAADLRQANDCGAMLGAGRACTITVTFTPKAVGSRSASLDIQVAPPASDRRIDVSGAGTNSSR